jgi:hypothetical protein
MGKRSTFTGYLRARGNSGSKLPTPAVVPQVLKFTFNGALANTTGTGKFLPKGAIIQSVDIVSAHTGGTTPAVDIGVLTATPDPDGIINGAVSTTTQRVQLAGAAAGVLVGAELAEDAEVSAGDDGTGTAGTGNITAFITYFMADDGVLNT